MVSAYILPSAAISIRPYRPFKVPAAMKLSPLSVRIGLPVKVAMSFGAFHVNLVRLSPFCFDL